MGIDIVLQNRLNTIKKIINFEITKKKLLYGYMIPLRGYPLRQSWRSLKSYINLPYNWFKEPGVALMVLPEA